MIIVIFGPTGSGKTDVAVSLAKHFDAPIINADAFQIYKDMDIGTNKISKDNPDYHRHYLLDIKSPEETYSVKEYQDDFRRILEELKKKYKTIIVSGGTGLYIRAALYDYKFLDEIEVERDYSSFSNEELYERLKSIDLEAASKIHPNNRKRVIRALNLIDNNGVKKSDLINEQEHKLIYDNISFYFLNPPRETLYENINLRVDQMMEKGLLNEVKNLKEKYQLSTTAYQAIGYKELLEYLDGEHSLDEAVELIKKRTRNYAKRQVTFFKNQFESKVFESKDALIKEIING